MPIYYPDVLSEGVLPRSFQYDHSDVILYALGIGLGSDPLDETELSFVYESALRTVPTAVTVLARLRAQDEMRPRPTPAGHRPSDTDRRMIVHGEQKVVLHRPLPPSGAFTVEARNTGAYDKGAGRGALLITESTWRDCAGEPVATITTSRFCRGDGGFGGPSGGAPAPHLVPERRPDVTVQYPTRPDQALLYRLNGDHNPLHVDPESARRAGFERPILHGLCTFGFTCRAILQSVVGYDADAILSHQVRFSGPVFPGEALSVELWIDGNEISFEAWVRSRDAKVVSNGLTRLRPAATTTYRIWIIWRDV